MKKIALALLLILPWSPSFSQNQAQSEIDSLKHLLSIGTMDTSRVQAMTALATAYNFYKPDSSIYYAQQALILARKIKYPKGEFQALFRLGFTLGMVGNYPRALAMQLKALRIAEKHNFLDTKAAVLGRLGNIYRNAGDYSKAVFFHRRQRLLADSLQNHDQVAGAQNLLGSDFLLMNNIDSAQHYILLSYENIQRWKVEFMRSPNFLSMSELQTKLGNFPLALDYLQKSIHYAYLRLDYFYTAQAYLRIAKIYQQTNQPDSTVFYAQKALVDAQKGNIYDQIGEASLFLSSIYEQKNAPLALRFQQIALAAKDSLYNFGNLNAIQNQAAFDEEERQYEIKTAQAAWQNQVWRYTLLAGLGMALLIAFILYYNNSQKQKANAVLEKTLSTLKSTQAQLIQSEKLASLGELTAGIAHEIQNPLNFVNNFAEVSAEMLDEMHEELEKGDTTEAISIATDLKINLKKINHHGQRASSIVKGMLEHSRASTGVKEPTDLNALADEYLRLAFHGLRAKDKDFNADYELIADGNLPKIEVIPQDIGRVLLNLINNAFWAVKTVETPKVVVKTEHTDSQLIIKVTDNGPGIPESIRDKIFQPFFTTKPTGQGTGLGLSLAYDIVTKGHGGTLEVNSTERVGSEFIITLLFKVI